MKNVILATLGMGLLAMGTINTASAVDLGAGFTVAPSCVFAPPHAATLTDNGNLDLGILGGGLHLDLVDPYAVGEATMSYSNTSCNYAATFSVESDNGGITTAGTAPLGFADKVDYTATANFCGEDAEIETALGDMSDTETCAGAHNGTFTLNVETDVAAAPLIAGVYHDTLTVHLGSLF